MRLSNLHPKDFEFDPDWEDPEVANMDEDFDFDEEYSNYNDYDSYEDLEEYEDE